MTNSIDLEALRAALKPTDAMIEAARMTLPGPVDICDADIEDIYLTMLDIALSAQSAVGESAVERSARAIYEYQNGDYLEIRPWDELPNPLKVSWRRCAEAALSASPVPAVDLLIEAAKEFVRKVDDGEAKSKKSYEQFKTALAALSASPVAVDTRQCTCHPDDNPPKPCPKKYALSECRAAAVDRRAVLEDEATVERVAKAMYTPSNYYGPWESLDEKYKEIWRIQSRHALSAIPSVPVKPQNSKAPD